METIQNYDTKNQKLLLNNIETFENEIPTLYDKRLKYTTILNNVILKYQELSDYTKQLFDRGL